jgi:hypothetical protein
MTARLHSINEQLLEVDHRLYRLEVEQQRQLRLITDTEGRVLELEGRLVNLEGEYVDLRTAIEQLEEETKRIRDIVYPDKTRFLRHGMYFSLFGLYADAQSLDHDSGIGGGASVQANVNKWAGVYGEISIIPLKASDISGPEGSSLTWITFPATVGIAVQLLPPQSPLSVQLSGGGGLAYSALRYYPPDFDPDLSNWEDVKTVSNLVGSGKVEIGMAPVLSNAEPTLTLGHLSFRERLEYQSPTAKSNAGRSLWYVSLGVRLRTDLPGEGLAQR